MKKVAAVALCLIVLISVLSGCGKKDSLANLPTPPPETAAPRATDNTAPFPTFARPSSVAVSSFQGGIARQVPAVADVTPPDLHNTSPSVYNTDTGWFGVNFSNQDLRGFSYDTLKGLMPSAVYNNRTIWPEAWPEIATPQEILEAAKDPGLGVDLLHRQGITGKGVSVAVIGEPLETDHSEIKDNLVDFEEFHSFSQDADANAIAMTSLLVGKTVGIAPDAKLYYFTAAPAETLADVDQDNPNLKIYNAAYIAQAYARVLEINSQLADSEQIKVVVSAVPFYFSDGTPGLSDYNGALTKLISSGVYVVSDMADYGQDVLSLLRDMKNGGTTDLNDVNNYIPNGDTRGEISAALSSFSEKDYLDNHILLVPGGSLTLAANTGPGDYLYIPFGDYGTARVYVAGLYALAVQVNPSVTPDVFWSACMDTAKPLTVHGMGANQDQDFTMQHVVSPAVMIDRIKQ